MALRELRFGDIILRTNGIDKGIYEPFFARENLPSSEDEHPQNWYAGKLRELAHSVGVPIDDLKVEHIERISEESKTRMDEEDIRRVNEQALIDQVCRDPQHTYEKTQGFFQDFINAWTYTNNLKHTGFHPWSKRVHSDLNVFGEGESNIVSDSGIVYQLKPFIFISGLSHDKSFSLELKIQSYLSESEKAGIHDFVLNHKWSDGSVIETEYWKISRDGRPYVDEIDHYVVTRKDLDTHAQVGKNSGLFTGFGLYGRMRNYKAFCQAIINELDQHFKNL